MTKAFRDRYLASGEEFSLADIDPATTPGMANEKKALTAVADLAPALQELQTRLYAERKQSLLLVLQGMDACGKDGVVKHVVSLLNPSGMRVTAFKAPTDVEKKHHFLWRFRPLLPPPGGISGERTPKYSTCRAQTSRRNRGHATRAAIMSGKASSSPNTP